MRCRYCNQRVNLFKSLAGSSFCSQDHQKLYEEAQANNAFERLLQFVEKEPKPRAGKPVTQPKLPVPQVVPEQPEPHTIPGRPTVPDPPAAGFLISRIAPPADASSQTAINPEILESVFPTRSPALPCFKPDGPKDATIEAPPPLASWSHVSLFETDSAKTSCELPSVDSVRPRSITMTVPSPDNPPGAPKVPASVLVSDRSGLQLAIQTALDNRVSANLARLNPLPQEGRSIQGVAPSQMDNRPLAPQPLRDGGRLPVAIQAGLDKRELANLWQLSPMPRLARAVQENAPRLAAKSLMADLTLSQTLDLSVLTPAKAASEIALGMSAFMVRTGVGRGVAAPAANRPHLSSSLSTSAVSCLVVATVQGVSGRGRSAVLTDQLGPGACNSPAMPWPGVQASASGLNLAVSANLKLDLSDRAAALGMHDAIARYGVARAVRPPQVTPSLQVNALGSNRNLNQVSIGLQPAQISPGYSISNARLRQRQCLAPGTEPPVPTHLRMDRSTASRALSIRERDTSVVAAIKDAMKPATASGRLLITAPLPNHNIVTISIDREARNVAIQVQEQHSFPVPAISPTRYALPECLLPAVLWWAETSLRSAVASIGWFHERDWAVQAIQPGAPASRLLVVRWASPWSFQAVPAIASNGLTRRLPMEACEWNPEAQRLSRSVPSRTSPLSLVARPQPGATRLAARSVAILRQFTSIVNPVRRGVAAPPAASAFHEEHKPVMALPQFSSGLPLAFRVSYTASPKYPAVDPSGQKNPGSVLRSQPSPVRAQPASMLVLPGMAAPWLGVNWPPGGKRVDEFMKFSTEQDTFSSIELLAAALRDDSRRASISSASGAQTAPPRVPPANALPRRSGPKLPVTTPQIDDLIVAGR
jgi:hypothetical protein